MLLTKTSVHQVVSSHTPHPYLRTQSLLGAPQRKSAYFSQATSLKAVRVQLSLVCNYHCSIHLPSSCLLLSPLPFSISIWFIPLNFCTVILEMLGSKGKYMLFISRLYWKSSKCFVPVSEPIHLILMQNGFGLML